MEEDIKKIEKGKYDRYKWSVFLENASNRRNSKENELLYEEYKRRFVKSMQDYADAKENDLKISLSYYKDAITTDFFNKNYITLNEKHINYILDRCKIMIITANPIEKAVLHHKIIDEGSDSIMTRILSETTAYYVFKWGKYWVAHIHQSQTGAGKDMGTNTTIADALRFFTPNVIISLGVAFGIDYDTQNIGDVLVSRKLLPYSENKRDEDYVKPDRTQDKIIDDWLHVRLENAVGFLDNVTYGDILSGGSVMSSFREKDRVCLGYTNADYIIGGEMEGNAVFQYAKRNGIPGVVIKGICDWGVAKNDIFKDDPDREEDFKDSLQAFAMEQAVEKCNPLFNDKELFSLPCNIYINKLKNRYHICLCLLLVSQSIMLINGFYRLLLNTNKNMYLLDEIGVVFNQPIIWFIIPIVLLLIIIIKFGIRLIHNMIWDCKLIKKRAGRNNYKV